MGKTKTKMIDDSVIAEEPKKQKQPKKKANQEPSDNRESIRQMAESNSEVLDKVVEDVESTTQETAQSESNEVFGEVELANSPESENQPGAQQAQSEPSGRANGTSGPDKQATSTKKQSKKVQKQGKPKERGKKYLAAREKVERNKLYPINEATELVKEVSTSKFDGTLEIHINTNTKGIRGLISLPFASGKKLNILAFGKGAEDSGADIIGDEVKLKEIMKGKIDFDVLVTTPDWMSRLAGAAKVLGPKGLMPNPKNGTISTDLKKTIAELQGGKVEYKSESKANVIHLGLGKVSQPSDELSQNIKILLSTIGKSKIKNASISPTMGPSLKLDLSSI